jgi:hypothetical protein
MHERLIVRYFMNITLITLGLLKISYEDLNITFKGENLINKTEPNLRLIYMSHFGDKFRIKLVRFSE